MGSISQEIRRRRRLAYKGSLYFLVPFGLTLGASALHAGPVVAGVLFASTIAGMIAWIVRFYSLSRCPACNQVLIYLFQTPEYERCPYCQTSFV